MNGFVGAPYGLFAAHTVAIPSAPVATRPASTVPVAQGQVLSRPSVPWTPCSPGYAHMLTSQGYTCVPVQRALSYGVRFSFPPYAEDPTAPILSLGQACLELE